MVFFRSAANLNLLNRSDLRISHNYNYVTSTESITDGIGYGIHEDNEQRMFKSRALIYGSFDFKHN